MFMANHMVLAGAMGLPAMGAFASALSMAFGDDDDPFDLEDELHEAFGGGVLADVLVKGAPAALGIDMSSNVGAADMFDPLPFVDADVRNREDANELVVALAGPSVGMFRDAMTDLAEGRLLRFWEKITPSVISGVSRAARQGIQGISKRNGDVLLPAEDYNVLDMTRTALGFRNLKDSKVGRETSKAYRLKQSWQITTGELKRRYAAARRDNDTEEMDEIRDAWYALQKAKVKHGEKATPLSGLTKIDKKRK
jgi:hypothetical protein